MTLYELYIELDSYRDDELIVCIPVDSNVLDRNTPVQILDDFDENDDPIIPPGLKELIPIFHLNDVVAGLKQLEGISDDLTLFNRLLRYFRDGA